MPSQLLCFHIHTSCMAVDFRSSPKQAWSLSNSSLKPSRPLTCRSFLAICRSLSVRPFHSAPHLFDAGHAQGVELIHPSHTPPSVSGSSAAPPFASHSSPQDAHSLPPLPSIFHPHTWMMLGVLRVYRIWRSLSTTTFCMACMGQAFCAQLYCISFTVKVSMPLPGAGSSFGACMSRMGQSFEACMSRMVQSFGACMRRMGQSFGACIRHMGQSFGACMRCMGLMTGIKGGAV